MEARTEDTSYSQKYNSRYKTSIPMREVQARIIKESDSVRLKLPRAESMASLKSSYSGHDINQGKKSGQFSIKQDPY